MFVSVVILVWMVVVTGGLTDEWSDRGRRIARPLATAGVVAFGLLVLVGLWGLHLLGAWRAGYRCPPLTSGPGRPSFGGWGGGTACAYPNGSTRHTVEHTGMNLFYSGWQAVGLMVLTLLLVGTAIVLAWRAWHRHMDGHRIDTDSVPLTTG